MIIDIAPNEFFPASSNRYVLYEVELNGELKYYLDVELANKNFLRFWFRTVADAYAFANRIRNAVDRPPQRKEVKVL